MNLPTGWKCAWCGHVEDEYGHVPCHEALEAERRYYELMPEPMRTVMLRQLNYAEHGIPSETNTVSIPRLEG